MRIMVRMMELSIIGFCTCLMLMHIFDLNVRLDELNKISSLAMSNTQIVVQENIEDRLYGTDNARLRIDSNDKYISLYKENLSKLISTDSTYEVSDYLADHERGLLYVKVDCSYKTLNGNTKTLSRKLLNIIDVNENYEENA